MLKPVAFVLPLFLVGCNDAPAAAGADRTGAAKPQATPPSALAALAQPRAVPEGPRAKGTVVETVDAGQYTYVRLKTESGDVWAAVTRQALNKGAEITIGNAMWMENFESKTLKRTFDHILFGSIVTDAAASVELPPGHAPVAPVTASQGSGGTDAVDVKVDKAQGKGAYTVAEIYASKTSLQGAEVLVRGRVVKWNAEIMGKNWIHLRDGSGSAEKQDNDITVTTTDTVAKGDVIAVRGKLGLDKDFTAGYVYPVIIEDAKVIK